MIFIILYIILFVVVASRIERKITWDEYARYVMGKEPGDLLWYIVLIGLTEGLWFIVSILHYYFMVRRKEKRNE